MAIPLSEVIQQTVPAVVESIVRAAATAFRTQKSRRLLHKTIADHLTEIQNWCSTVQFMAECRDTGKNTVSLDVRTVPRRFQARMGQTVSEENLLHTQRHIVLLGDPGSGKTTTLKRISRSLLMRSKGDKRRSYRYPVVLLLREYDTHMTLYQNIATILGIPFKVNHEYEKESSSHRIIKTTIFVGNSLIQEAIPDTLDASKALLLLDGLDEVSISMQRTIIMEIQQLARKLSSSCILVTCRSGAFEQTLDGFLSLELAPLNDKQIEEIASRWLDSPAAFVKRLRELPLRDMANRPLLLSQLIYIFNCQEDLPDRPSLVYRQITRLLLQDWDRSRGVMRQSRYAGFDPDSKMEFLAALSHELTCRARKTRFSEDLLVRCYQRLRERFGLPEGQALQVVREIETHNGIVIAVGPYDYEFCHRSIQEYLCGDYLSREPISDTLRTYLHEYPEAVGVAAALASRPTMWFAEIILRYWDEYEVTEQPLVQFISRALLEIPQFELSSALGDALIKLHMCFFARTSEALRAQFDKLLSRRHASASLALALQSYLIRRDKSMPGKSFFLAQQYDLADLSDYSTRRFRPYLEGHFPEPLLLRLARSHGIKLHWSGDDKRIGHPFQVSGKDYTYAT